MPGLPRAARKPQPCFYRKGFNCARDELEGLSGAINALEEARHNLRNKARAVLGKAAKD